MDLKNTKATAQLITADKFKAWVLASGIVAVSEGSKNTLPHGQTEKTAKSTKSYLKGLESENKVIAHLQSHLWELQFQRARTEIAEIDLIVQKGRQVKLIEVKTLDNPWRSFERISHRQVQKLILNQLYLSQKISQKQKNFELSSYIAWVSPSGIKYLSVN